jgi:hypothetical protein
MDFKALLENFLLHETVFPISKFGNGLMNDSQSIVTAESEARNSALQRINHHVFTDVDLLQTNVFKTLQHIRARLVAADERDNDGNVLSTRREVGRSDPPAQEVKPTIDRQEDEFAAEVDGHERVELPPHGRYRALSTCDYCIDAVQVHELRAGELCVRETPRLVEDPRDCWESEAAVVVHIREMEQECHEFIIL